MQFASFDFGDPVFDVAGFRVSAQVVTRSNVFGLDPANTSVRSEDGDVVVRAAGLRAAGGQLSGPGAVIVRARDIRGGGVRISVKARAQESDPVRCIKLMIRDLDAPLALVDEHGERTIGAFGEILAYPNRLPLPMACVRAGDTLLGLRVEEDRVREHRFALSTERIGPLTGRGVIEWIAEAEATSFAKTFEAPPLVVTRGVSHAGVEAAHLDRAERTLGLASLSSRGDAPAWLGDLRCVLALHGMHFTGRVFLDYASMLEVVRFAAEHISPRHILVYLPGWEGRYYWQYGEWRPDPRLGGEEGFARLVDAVRGLGAHVMPMFGGNCVNAWLPRFSGLDPAAYMKSATGNRFHGNQPDWDFSRAHDTGWQAWLNPGHPAFRDDLVTQIASLATRFGFDGVFLDTIHIWQNDPDYAVYPGIVALAQRLREAIPGVLLAAEHDYDALCAVFPLFQRAYWGKDAGYASRYALRFAHLCEGEPEGRTGVHEFGVWKTPGGSDPHAPADGYLPTFSFQDDTLARHRETLAAALARITG